MQNKIEQLVKWLIPTTFFVPLVMIPSSFIFPFIVPKIIVFRSLVLLLLGGYLMLLVGNWNKFKPRLTPITIAVTLFFLSFTISTFAGVDWYHSFWDNHERMLGLFTIFHYVIYYLIVSSVVRDWRDWRWILRTFLFAGGIVMFIGILQRFNPTLLLNQSGDRVASTLGNPIYVGGYGLFLSFLGWLLAVKEAKRAWKIYAIVGSILGFIGMLISGTRGSLLGWIAGVAVLCAVYFFTLKEHKRLRQTFVALFIVFVCLLTLSFVFRKTDFVRQIPAVGNLVNTQLGSGTSDTRLMAWGIALDGWKERPIFGWGPNNFFYTFNKYYRPEFLRHGWGETWFDNAHNIIMNTLAVQGTFGIITYLALFAAVFTVLYKGYRKQEIDKHTLAIGTGFFIAHLVQNIFVFENPTSYLYFFFMLGWVEAVANAKHVEFTAEQNQAIPVGFVGLVSVVILLLIYATDINVARANQATLGLLRSLYTGEYTDVQHADTIAIPSPHIDDIRNDFARTASQVISQYNQRGLKDQIKALLITALDDMRLNRLLHPLDIRVQLQQAQIANQLAIMTNNVDYVLEGEDALLDALQKSPKRQQVLYMISGQEIYLQKSDAAVAFMKTALDEDQTIGESWWRMALVYQQVGKMKEAQNLVREARNKQIPFDDTGLGAINGILPLPAATSTVK